MNEKASESAAVPIREISRLTGVNTVTLRAWERRYGLLKPMRTDKGHRLYSLDDIQRVKTIQSWLVRGLAISKVKNILASGDTPLTQVMGDSVWLEYAVRVETALTELNRSNLEKLLGELIVSYPAELIADQLLTVIYERLQLQRDYSMPTRLAFLNSVVKEQFYFGQYRQRQAADGKRLLLVKLNPEENTIFPLILNYALLVHTFRSEYPGFIPVTEWIFAAEQLQVEGLIIYSDSATNISLLQQHLLEWQQARQMPVFLAGKITRMYSPSVAMNLGAVFAGDCLQTIIATVTQQFPE